MCINLFDLTTILQQTQNRPIYTLKQPKQEGTVFFPLPSSYIYHYQRLLINNAKEPVEIYHQYSFLDMYSRESFFYEIFSGKTQFSLSQIYKKEFRW